MYFYKVSPASVPSGLSYNFVCYWRQSVDRVNGVVSVKDEMSVTVLFKS